MIIVCLAAALFCALQSVRAISLLLASLWLGGVSIAVAMILYLLGAREMAVIELSVSAGLVMVLLVFAITVLGDPTPQMSRIHLSALTLVMTSVAGLVLLALPAIPAPAADAASPLAGVVWHDRSLDILLQIVLLFVGALAVLRLLKQPVDNPPVASASADDVTSLTHDGAVSVSEAEPGLEMERELA